MSVAHMIVHIIINTGDEKKNYSYDRHNILN